MSERVGLTVKKPEVNRDNSDSRMRRVNHSLSVNPSVDRILFLQKTVGNQAVQRLLRSGVLQAKLRIGQPGDVYEQEADRVADEVMRMAEPQAVSQEDTHIQQACEGCEEEELRRQPEEEEEEELLQTKEMSGQNAETTPDLESRINAIMGSGQSLTESERSFFEPRFGCDFNKVRVHSDTQADRLNLELNARAFTSGQDIFFREGEYSVDGGSESRKRLLAHELTHVVQQKGNFAGTSSRNMIMRSNDDFPTEYNLDCTFDEDFDNFQAQIIPLIGERVYFRSRDRATDLVMDSNLFSIHQQLLAASIRTGRRLSIHASFSWTGSRVEAVTFSLRIEVIDIEGISIQSRLHLYDILNNPAHRAHFIAQYRVMISQAEEWQEQHPGVHGAAARSSERHGRMGEWLMRNYPRLRGDNETILRSWFYEPSELLEQHPGESSSEFNLRVRDRVDAYVSSVNARYRREIYDRFVRECGVEGGCTPEGRNINEHMRYLTQTYGSAPW
jgi:hypothetical protein